MKQESFTTSDLFQIWNRIRNKMNIVESIPYNFGIDKPLFISEIHTIHAIGSTPKNNVRIIADVLGVTPSAASQVITKLTKRGLVRKIRGVHNEKEVSLELTEKGLIAFKNHEQFHAQDFRRISERIGNLSEEERLIFGQVFSEVESIFDERIEELKKVGLLQDREAKGKISEVQFASDRDDVQDKE
jgi:DNA-binding MarR family transcriptional regulator